LAEDAENHIIQPWGVRGWKGGGGQETQSQPASLIPCGGGGAGER
jgi:hypothetical protein